MKSVLVLLSLAAGIFLTAFSIVHIHTVFNGENIDPSSMIYAGFFPYAIIAGAMIWCVALICMTISCKKQ